MERARIAPPLALRQPVPDAVTFQDLIVEAALQLQIPSFQITRYERGRVDNNTVRMARAALVTVGHDIMGYSFRQLAAMLGQPLKRLANGYYNAAPRFRSKETRYVSLERHLELFARGLPSHRIDKVRRSTAFDPTSRPPEERLLQLWFEDQARRTDDGMIRVRDVVSVGNECGLTRQGVSRLTCRLIDRGVIENVDLTNGSAMYRIRDSRKGPGTDDREAKMTALWSLWITRRQTPSQWPHDYPYMALPDISHVDETKLYDPDAIIPRVVLDVNQTFCLEEYGINKENKPKSRKTKYEIMGMPSEKEVRRCCALWNEMARKNRLPLANMAKIFRNHRLYRRFRIRIVELHGIMNWQHYIDRIARSSFLRGEGGVDFKADLLWALDAVNMFSVLSGAYDDDRVGQLPGKTRTE